MTAGRPARAVALTKRELETFEDGVHAGIGGDHLEARACRRVALEHAGDVLGQQREQARCRRCGGAS